MHGGQTVERTHEERSRSNGRIQYGDGLQDLSRSRIPLSHSPLSFCLSTPQPGNEKRHQGGIEDFSHHGSWGIESSGSMPSLGCHHSFEDSPQHVRSHPLVTSFTHRKVKPI